MPPGRRRAPDTSSSSSRPTLLRSSQVGRPGSTSPGRVAVASSSAGVRPMVASTDSPLCTVHEDAPAPRWQVSARRRSRPAPGPGGAGRRREGRDTACNGRCDPVPGPVKPAPPWTTRWPTASTGPADRRKPVTAPGGRVSGAVNVRMCGHHAVGTDDQECQARRARVDDQDAVGGQYDGSRLSSASTVHLAASLSAMPHAHASTSSQSRKSPMRQPNAHMNDLTCQGMCSGASTPAK